MNKTVEQLQHQIKNLEEILKSLKSEVAQIAAIYPTPLQKEKAYTWEECFQGKGYWSHKGLIKSDMQGDFLPVSGNTTIATTQKIIQSNDAACQLSHIIEAINKDFQEGISVAISANKAFNCGFQIGDYIVWALPRLNSTDAGLKLIETNRPLLLQYFGIEEK